MTNSEFATHQLTSWSRRVFSVPLAALLMLLPVSSYALDTLCAKVKIEIVQELTKIMKWGRSPIVLTSDNRPNNELKR